MTRRLSKSQMRRLEVQRACLRHLRATPCGTCGQPVDGVGNLCDPCREEKEEATRASIEMDTELGLNWEEA